MAAATLALATPTRTTCKDEVPRYASLLPLCSATAALIVLWLIVSCVFPDLLVIIITKWQASEEGVLRHIIQCDTTLETPFQLEHALSIHNTKTPLNFSIVFCRIII